VRYLKLICGCLLNNEYIELSHVMISYIEIIHICWKTHISIVQVIISLDITKLYYIKNTMFFWLLVALIEGNEYENIVGFNINHMKIF